MNLLGKVLVMVIFIFSLVFMAFSIAVYSTHKNWRDEAFTLQGDLTTEQQLHQNLKNRMTAIEGELAQERTARQQVLASLETSVVEHRSEVAALNSQLEELQGQNRQAVATMAANEQTLADLREEKTRLLDQLSNVRTEKDEAFQETVRLTDDLNERTNDLTLLQARHMALLEQRARMTTVLERYDLDEHEPVDGLPPRVDGIILAIGDGGLLVEISLGSDDGLRKGHMLEVFRVRGSTSKYLGRIEVLKTDIDVAVAKVIPEFRKAMFQKDDRVATRLN